MPSSRIDRNNTALPHYLTLTVVHWYYLFDRHNRWEILQDALAYRINHQQLKIYAFVFMLNHLHLIVSAPDLIAVIRDFKKYTTYQMKLSLGTNEPRVLEILKDTQGQFQLWQKTNMPIVLESPHIVKQKIAYIHNNPVKKQYTRNPEAWYWSSANPECPIPIEPLI